MSKLEIAKEVIKDNFTSGDCGLFFTGNFAGDHMTTIYNKNGLTIDICYEYLYFEVFGLDHKEEIELNEFYESLQSDGIR